MPANWSGHYVQAPSRSAGPAQLVRPRLHIPEYCPEVEPRLADDDPGGAFGGIPDRDGRAPAGYSALPVLRQPDEEGAAPAATYAPQPFFIGNGVYRCLT